MNTVPCPSLGIARCLRVTLVPAVYRFFLENDRMNRTGQVSQPRRDMREDVFRHGCWKWTILVDGRNHSASAILRSFQSNSGRWVLNRPHHIIPHKYGQDYNTRAQYSIRRSGCQRVEFRAQAITCSVVSEVCK